jgi:hypothetical protein
MTLSVLASYAFADEHRDLPPGSRLMLDSGGYTAWTKGIEIRLPDLAAWYRSVPAQRYAALDVLYDPAASLANALALRELGADVTPAVHAGTSPAEVDRIADHGFTTVALGGLVNRRNSRPDADGWAHTCLDRAAARGLAVHGFGLSPSSAARLPLLLRFDSIDSSTWVSARYAADTRLWDGRTFRSYDMNVDRMKITALMRHWPGDWTPMLTRHRADKDNPNSGASLRQTRIAGAASMLAWGQWLRARGGPRVYLASYINNLSADADAEVNALLDAIGPGEPREEPAA